ncbi:probable cation transporter HKT7 [Durio zibethinus]|uniref:Probable cation transporter HKT7 n=1 Tax=Durio zibethinus TaxID=66656 RepID=A0A6P5ZS34_DURZI|nr:probable cation transporter HKT7 [Durio zibethinus]
MQHFHASCLKLACLKRSIYHQRLSFFLFWIELCYYVLLSVIGFWFLKVLKARPESFRPRNIDLFFTSVSAATVSSMSTVEMEVFSNSQLVIITILMFIGGEVFTSMAGFFLRNSKSKEVRHNDGENVAPDRVRSTSSNSSYPGDFTSKEINEAGEMRKPDSENKESGEDPHHRNNSDGQHLQSMKFLGFVVLWYLLVVNGLGIALVSLYLSLVSSAREVLKRKGLKLFTFSVFTTVSTFANCGFVPTNENMMVFSKNSLLLLILIPQVLLGNTLFPPCLRFSIWVVGKLVKKVESNSKYLLENTKEIGYSHLLPRRHSSFLVVTVFGFIVVQILMFCLMEWNSEAVTGLNPSEKIVGLLFQSVNSRYAGETIIDLSIISPAILVLLVVMMYLPPYTSFILMNEQQYPSSSETSKEINTRGKIVESIILSQLSYLAIFVILICISERRKLKDDPLNFNVLNIVVEVVSAYGNVGFTTGYSCKRRIKAVDDCVDKWYGFAGKWSDAGKIILMGVMFFGRLKSFNIHGSKAWKLL